MPAAMDKREGKPLTDKIKGSIWSRLTEERGQ